MKLTYLLLLIFPFIFLSCNKSEEINTESFDAIVSKKVQIYVSGIDASANDFYFVEFGIISLLDNPDLKYKLRKLQSIEIKNLEIEFSGIEDEMEIKTIDFSVNGIGTFATINNVNSTNLNFSPSVDNEKLLKMSSIMLNNWQITAEIEGRTNVAPLYFSVEIKYDLHLEAETL